MNLRTDPSHALPPLSPISPDWNPLSNYDYPSNQSSNRPSPSLANFGPKAPIPHSADTPPLSVHSSANSSNAPDGLHLGLHGNPSPPSSVDRTSIVTTATIDERRYQEMEQTLAVHHRALVRFLGPYLRDLRADPQQNRATDKLQRLSIGQFQELSTDVYDELTRRDEERRRGGPNPGNPVPKYLLPKTTFHVKRNQARQKLSTLPPDRFQQLATDVFFELERRFPRFGRSGSRADNGPIRDAPSRNGNNMFPPRSQSRGALQSPPRENYRDQNFPPRDASNNLGKPLPKMFQSNVMIPNKGTMVEDDDDLVSVRSMNVNGSTNLMVSQYKNDLQALERKVDDLVVQLARKDEQLDEAIKSPKIEMDAQRTEFDGLRTTLERKLRDAQSLNDSLQAEIARVRSEKSELERNRSVDEDLKLQLDEARRAIKSTEDDWRRKLDDAQREARQSEEQLREQLVEARNQPRGGFDHFDDVGNWRMRYEALDGELQEQKSITEEVRREASRFLQEMRDLSLQSSEALEKEDQLQDQVRRLEQEVKTWKSRFAKVQTANPDAQSSIFGSSDERSDVSVYLRDPAYLTPNGVIKDMNITNFQLAIDDLLQQARSGNDRTLSDSIKMVVMAVKLITIDMDNEEAQAGGDPSKLSNLKMRLSQAANNMITVTKSFSSMNGLASVVTIDDGASYLSGAIIDIVKALKIRRSTPEELAEEDRAPVPDYMYSARPAPLNTRTKGSLSGSSINSGIMRNVSSSSAAYSSYRYSGGYSRNTSPQAVNEETPYTVGQGMGLLREDSVLEFKNYVEDVNVSLTRNIQPLVNTIRSQPAILADDPIITTYVDEISSSVFRLVDQTKSKIKELSNVTLSIQAPPVTDFLASTARDLLAAKDRGDVSSLPQLAFKISRTTKALVLRLQKIENGELDQNSPSTLDVL